MKRSPPLLLPVLFLLTLASGCGEPAEDPPTPSPCEGAGCEDPNPEPTPEPEPEPQCAPGSVWAPGTPIFREATAAWGLDALGVVGVRLAVTDLDGDGWADLTVRRGGSRSDDFGPDGARQSWILRNNGGVFEDITQDSGIRAPRGDVEGDLGHPGEVFAFADVNNDGRVDVFAGVNTTDPNLSIPETSELYLQNDAGGFDLGPEDSDLRRLDDVPAGAAFIDFDRDGLIDLWVTQNTPSGQREPAQDRLYRGDGTGRFTDVTARVGLSTFESTPGNLNAAQAHSNAWSAAACDLNGDGIPELLAASYGRAPNHLWQGAGDAQTGFSWSNRSVASRYAFDHRSDWSDNESARCFCMHNRDATGCADVPEPQFIRCDSDADAFRWNHPTDRQPYRLGGVSGTTVCADINNTGALDLLTTEIVHWDVGTSADPSEILFNNGQLDVKFNRVENADVGLDRDIDRVDWNNGDITAAVFDFDNDRWPDLFIGSTDYPGARGLLYHQSARGSFTEVPVAEGLDHNRSHGVAVADFDRDGDLDLIVGHSRARCSGSDDCYDVPQVRFFENVLGQNGHWLQLAMTGADGTNRAAIGARVTVEAAGVTQTQEIGGGHGHYGIQHDTTLHFGLGDACEATVTVRWPDAALTTQTFTLTADHRYTLTQSGDPAVSDL